MRKPRIVQSPCSTGIGHDVDAVVRERLPDVDQVELRLAAADLGARVPDVAEGAAHGLRGRRAREGGDRLALAEVERADVVEAHQVIGVRMGEEDEVEPRNRIAQQLQAQVGRGVDQKVFAVRLALHRLPQPLVLRVRRLADGARAADDRNAGGGAGAEEGYFHMRSGQIATVAQKSGFSVKVRRAQKNLQSSLRASVDMRARHTDLIPYSNPNSPVTGSITIASPALVPGGQDLTVAPSVGGRAFRGSGRRRCR